MCRRGLCRAPMKSAFFGRIPAIKDGIFGGHGRRGAGVGRARRVSVASPFVALVRREVGCGHDERRFAPHGSQDRVHRRREHGGGAHPRAAHVARGDGREHPRERHERGAPRGADGEARHRGDRRQRGDRRVGRRDRDRREAADRGPDPRGARDGRARGGRGDLDRGGRAHRGDRGAAARGDARDPDDAEHGGDRARGGPRRSRRGRTRARPTWRWRRASSPRWGAAWCSTRACSTR